MRIHALFVVFLGAFVWSPRPAAAHPGGAPGCEYPGGLMVAGSRTGSGGYALTASATTWQPGTPVTITLSGARNMKGFLIAAVTGAPGTLGLNHVGSFTPPADTQAIGCGPGNALTHTSAFRAAPRQSVSVSWMPPPSGSGPVTFHAVAVVSLGEWYGQSTPITLTLAKAEPVDCTFGEWSDWSGCDVTCGAGTQQRTRPMLQAPSGGGASCPSLLETRPCDQGTCDRDCIVSEFGDWSSCSAACGGGEQVRRRTIVVEPRANGAACPALQEARACNPQACPVDCVVGAFGEWGACTGTCGTGERRRSRSVTTPAANGGEACPELEETGPCALLACPPDTAACEASPEAGYSRPQVATGLTLESCGATIQLPAEALAAGTEVTFARLERVPSIPLPRWALRPATLRLSVPATISLPSPSTIANGEIERCDADFSRCERLETTDEGDVLRAFADEAGIFQVVKRRATATPDAGPDVQDEEVPAGCSCGAAEGVALLFPGLLLLLRRRRPGTTPAR